MPRKQTATHSVWDPLLRLFHWLLAAFFLLAYLLEGNKPVLHSHAGYTVALLVGFRALWGFIGPGYARWRSFLPAPVQLLRYLGALVRGSAPIYRGHDPAGALMILLLMVCLLGTAFTGMVLFAMEGSGPLAHTGVVDWHGGSIERLHQWLADITAVLAAMHVTGVLVMSYLHRQNLIRAMITGAKQDPS